MDRLCKLCESIPWDNLPVFPDGSYMRTLSGKPHLQHLIQTKSSNEELASWGFKHHQDLESLRSAAKDGCGLCRLIEAQTDAVLSDIEDLGKPLLGVCQAYPTFDLWICKRPDGDDGLWVLTNSTWEKRRCIIPMAAIAFCADEDDPLANVFKGRVIRRDPGEKAFSRISDWLASCDEHERCSHQGRAMPTRVVDVFAESPGTTVRLVETTPEDEEKYIALSYCWGGGTKKYTTTQASMEERKQAINIGSLPRTFQDAIALTRFLGVKYLWIDSLCICQDQVQEWERESAKMAMVYANAYLTVAATGVDGSDGGLFFPRTPPSSIRIPREAQGSTGTLVACALPLNKELIKSYHIDMRSEPLTMRAWGFQERVLSRRVLHFAKDQIYFECLEGTRAEDGLTLSHRFPHARQGEDPTVKEQSSREYQRSENPIIEQWYSLLWSYGPRKLTLASDKLPALSGIARIYQDLLQDEYLAGIWKSSILEGICWQSLKCSKPDDDAYRAPSWSWASVDGIPAAGFDGANEPLATVVDSHVDVDGGNPFGRVKGGWLRLKAPLVPLSLSETKGPTGHMFLRTRKGNVEGTYAGFDTVDRSFAASADFVQSMKLYALVIARTGPSSERTTYRSLIVTPDGLDAGNYKRVGFLLQDPQDFGPDELDSVSDVVLV